MSELQDKLLFKLSSIGYALHCNVAFTSRNSEINKDISQVKTLSHGDSIYISPSETNINYDELISILIEKNIQVDFYLMGEPVISENLIQKLLPYSIHIFAMNNIYNHPKIHNMPIGIRDCGKLTEMHKGFYHDDLYNQGKQTVEKEYLCLLCFSLCTHNDRHICYYELKNKDFVVNINHDNCPTQPYNFIGYVPLCVNYEYLHKSVYCLSPRGGGEATHRFFEAIYLDSIPIVKKTNTPFDKLYNVFPCLIVNDWNEVTKELLEQNKDVYQTKLKDFKEKYPNAFTDLNSIHELLLQT
jgi:hypothetical protein